jgi:hypothetical protein
MQTFRNCAVLRKGDCPTPGHQGGTGGHSAAAIGLGKLSAQPSFLR